MKCLAHTMSSRALAGVLLSAGCGGAPPSESPPDLAPPADLAAPPDLLPPQPPRPPGVLLPRTSIAPAELAIVVNEDFADSAAIAEIYRMKRGIPAANVVRVKLGAMDNVGQAAFIAEYQKVTAALPMGVQGFALAFARPYRVDCMSVTSAFALGFDRKYCNTQGGCRPTTSVDYYDSDSSRPFPDHKLRPAMSLVGRDLAEVTKLIDRGLAADGSLPAGEGWLLRTSDKARAVRWTDLRALADDWLAKESIRFTYVDNSAGKASDFVENKADVLFYFTGLVRVPKLETNKYLPGAVADHLTSFGGALYGGGQMPINEWIEAGATGSYGTVVEPCNFLTKFPVASVMVRHYFRGETLLEAYWKSVAMPGEGIFAGDPLARPWSKAVSLVKDGMVVIRTTAITPGYSYALECGESENGPWTEVLRDLKATDAQWTEIRPPAPYCGYYRITGGT